MDLESQLPTNQFDKEMAEWAEKPLPERIARILLCCVLSVIVVFVVFWVVVALEEGDGQHSGFQCEQPKYKKLPKDQYYEEALLTPDANWNDNQLDYESEETNIDFNAPKDLGIATGDDIDERKFKQDASDLESRYLADPDDVSATMMSADTYSIFENDPRDD
eukprot:265399_1